MSLTAFDLDGNAMTLDINMIGATNKFLGDILPQTTLQVYITLLAVQMSFTIQVDPTNTL